MPVNKGESKRDGDQNKNVHHVRGQTQSNTAKGWANSARTEQ